jgi:Mg2+ and Co2+ transporter CorA
MEKVGVHKRDIMVDRVEDTNKAQQDAQEQFTSALDALKALNQFDGGDLETAYNDINDQYEASSDAAEKVSERIAAIEDVADALFDEWENELSLYTSTTLKRDSEKKLRATQTSYKKMLTAMHKAERKMTPVLNTLRDNTLYLKHNLNAAAIGSLQGEFTSLQKDIQRAINDMQIAIDESERFIFQLKKT